MAFLAGAFAFACCFVLVPLSERLAWGIGAVDIPRDGRRMHAESIPRAGGIAVFGSFALACLVFCPGAPLLRAALLGGALIFSVGLADDMLCLGAWSKLFFQVAVSVGAVFGSGLFSPRQMPIAVLWVVTLTNAHNFIDGLDGLFAGCAAIEGGLLSLAFWLAGGRLFLPPLLLSLACLAFRYFNRAPARIFAGDCGSGSVGFLLGMLSLPLFGGFATQIPSLAPLFLFAYPLTDLVTAAARRVLRGKSPFAADRAHLHHRIAAVGLDHAQCCGVLLALTASLGTVGVLLEREYLLWFASGASLLSAGVLLILRRYILSFSEKQNRT